MSELRIEQVDGDAMIEDWRHVHNTIIPADPLSLDDVRERSGRNHLEVAYAGDVLVGCSTVRPPAGESKESVVIARILPEHRRRGYGTRLYERGLARARELGAEAVETIVLGTNVEGLRFAEEQGFVEVENYVLPGGTERWHTLRLP
ncbi:GNAT family N-acetyltransferase [Phytomonospora sp. NPDC050363]|uniref:GNAT family N-acetyltransferase n=1 Tax=Phytomonospora sp. NPDC050363 TaxID=3155642 RepID=UPI0033EB6F63